MYIPGYIHINIIFHNSYSKSVLFVYCSQEQCDGSFSGVKCRLLFASCFDYFSVFFSPAICCTKVHCSQFSLYSTKKKKIKNKNMSSMQDKEGVTLNDSFDSLLSSSSRFSSHRTCHSKDCPRHILNYIKYFFLFTVIDPVLHIV